jgi:hypothetical protein
MALLASLRAPGLPATDYYAPNFRVAVEGRELDPEMKGDVLDLKVTMDKENLTSFAMTVNNWDDRHFTFKYSDARIFEVGNRVVIRMGYADDLRFMASGLISALTPNFPESAPSTLGITGVDAMLKLRDRKPVGSDRKDFSGLRDWQIAQQIAERNHLKVKVTKVGPQHDIVVQKNQDDAQFLMERAARIDFDFFIRIDPDTCTLPTRPTDATGRCSGSTCSNGAKASFRSARACGSDNRSVKSRSAAGTRAPSRRSPTPLVPPTCWGWGRGAAVRRALKWRRSDSATNRTSSSINPSQACRKPATSRSAGCANAPTNTSPAPARSSACRTCVPATM